MPKLPRESDTIHFEILLASSAPSFSLASIINDVLRVADSGILTVEMAVESTAYLMSTHDDSIILIIEMLE